MTIANDPSYTIHILNPTPATTQTFEVNTVQTASSNQLATFKVHLDYKPRKIRHELVCPSLIYRINNNTTSNFEQFKN